MIQRSASYQRATGQDSSTGKESASVRNQVPAHLRGQEFSSLGLIVTAEMIFLACTVLWQPRPLGVALAISLLAALILALWITRRSLRGISARWVLPPSPHAGSDASLGTVLTARPSAPPLQVKSFLPSVRRFETVAHLPGIDGKALRPVWQVRFPRRGVFQLPPVVVCTQQPFGLISASRTVGVGSEVLVLPTLGHMRRELRTQLNQWLEALSITTDPGEDEIARLRDYRPGDHPHRIHWKASARCRSLLVAERHAPGCKRLAVVVDTRVAGEGRRLERIICFAATLVDYLVRHGWTVSLHGEFAGAGVMGDRTTMMEALAYAGPGEEPVESFIPTHRAVVVLCLNPLSELNLMPPPLILPLSLCEQLIRLPIRMR